MQLFNFIASLAKNYREHYLSLANQVSVPDKPLHSSDSQPTTIPTSELSPNTDTYLPSPEAGNQVASSLAPATETDKADLSPAEVGDKYVPSESVNDDEVPVPQDAVYNFERQAKLDYSANLQFNLSAMMSTLNILSEGGDVENIEQFAAAGFGLSADLKFSGRQTIETSQTTDSEISKNPTHIKQKYRSKATQATRMAYQDRSFALQAFHRESEDIRQSLDIKERDGHRRVTNKIALRYRMDSQFELSFLNRFNVQTKTVAETTPSSMGTYLNSTGNVTEKGTPEMMATFFDAVDSYLNGAEEKIIAKASEFFDIAASELGFSSEAVDMAREQLVNTIEGFFNRVDMAIDGLESKFYPTIDVAPDVEPSISVPLVEDTSQLAVA